MPSEHDITFRILRCQPVPPARGPRHPRGARGPAAASAADEKVLLGLYSSSSFLASTAAITTAAPVPTQRHLLARYLQRGPPRQQRVGGHRHDRDPSRGLHLLGLGRARRADNRRPSATTPAPAPAAAVLVEEALPGHEEGGRGPEHPLEGGEGDGPAGGAAHAATAVLEAAQEGRQGDEADEVEEQVGRVDGQPDSRAPRGCVDLHMGMYALATMIQTKEKMDQHGTKIMRLISPGALIDLVSILYQFATAPKLTFLSIPSGRCGFTKGGRRTINGEDENENSDGQLHPAEDEDRSPGLHRADLGKNRHGHFMPPAAKGVREWRSRGLGGAASWISQSEAHMKRRDQWEFMLPLRAQSAKPTTNRPPTNPPQRQRAGSTDEDAVPITARTP
ncbi:uncharacterized protein E0L32_008075 [Thyridium curvatum]|uniref:Uncharacterized protein n=1 Tax=Thyridium curvatum TaxID=1093900 RepID=A0A507B298_9PEZI|nr:uncharacterized protein E0L32_008075 [Thyridium curvatum]TPX11038.1 hypothetical protein E0L32_008075 [Thyridium curvatum]